jgi:hypothetical protein
MSDAMRQEVRKKRNLQVAVDISRTYNKLKEDLWLKKQ